jgi:hypothetical protein
MPLTEHARRTAVEDLEESRYNDEPDGFAVALASVEQRRQRPDPGSTGSAQAQLVL